MAEKIDYVQFFYQLIFIDKQKIPYDNLGRGLIPRKYYSSNDGFFFPEKHFSNTFPEFDESEKLNTHFPKQIARTLAHCVRVKATQCNRTHFSNTFTETHLSKVLNQLKVPNRKGLFGRVKFPALEVLNFLLWTCYQAHSSRFLPTLSPYSPFILRSNWGKKTCLIEGIITSKSVEDILPTLTCPFQTQDAASRKRSTSSTKRRNWIRNTPRWSRSSRNYFATWTSSGRNWATTRRWSFFWDKSSLFKKRRSDSNARKERQLDFAKLLWIEWPGWLMNNFILCMRFSIYLHIYVWKINMWNDIVFVQF